MWINCVRGSVLGDNVQEFFFRVAALAFEESILKDLEKGITPNSIGRGNSIGKGRLSVIQGQGNVNFLSFADNFIHLHLFI